MTDREKGKTQSVTGTALFKKIFLCMDRDKKGRDELKDGMNAAEPILLGGIV